VESDFSAWLSLLLAETTEMPQADRLFAFTPWALRERTRGSNAGFFANDLATELPKLPICVDID
jgi:hypothetical protein